MTPGRLLAGLAGGLVAGIAVFAVWLSMIDVNAYKPEIIAEAEALTGRKVRLAGPLEVMLWPEVALQAERVTIANAPWSGDEPMVKVGKLGVSVALWPLLGGRFEVERVSLSGVKISLERNQAGEANWAFGASDREGVGATRVPAVALGAVKIDDLVVRYKADGQVYDLALETLGLLPEGEGVAFSAAGEALGIRWSMEGTSGSLHTLLTRAAPFPFTLQASALESELTVEGTVSETDTATVSLELNRKATRMTGNVAVDFAMAPWRVDATLRAGRLDLGPFAAAPNVTGSTDASARVIPDVAFPWPRLAGVTGKARVEIGQVTVNGLALDEVAIESEFGGDRLRVAPLTFRLGGNAIEARLLAEHLSSHPHLTAEVKARGLKTAPALEAIGVEPQLATSANVDLVLAGPAPDLRTWFGGSTGHLRWMSGKGRLSGGAEGRVSTLNAAVGGVTTLIGAFQAKGAKEAALNCIAIDLAVEDGVAKVHALVGDTEYASVAGTGTTSLKDESLSLTVDPRPKSVTLNVAVPINIGGTWDRPTYTPDPVAVTRRVGGVAAALLFPPSTLLSLTGLGTASAAVVGGGGDVGSDDNPCLMLGKRPAKAQGVVEKVGKTAQGAVEAIGGAIKKLFGN